LEPGRAHAPELQIGLFETTAPWRIQGTFGAIGAMPAATTALAGHGG